MRSRNVCVTAIAVLLPLLGGYGRGQTPPIASDPPPQPADAAFVEAERALTVRLLDNAIAQADADAVLLEQAKKATSALAARAASLRTSDEGKKVAAGLDVISAGQIEQFMVVAPTSGDSLAAKEKELGSLTQDLKKLRADPPAGFTPPDQQQDELVRIGTDLRQTLAVARERDGWLTTLAAASPKDLDVTAAPTLEAVLSNLRAREQQSLNAARRIGIDQAKPVGLSEITEAAWIAALERAQQQASALLDEQRTQIELARVDLDMKLRLLREQKDRELAELNLKLAESEARREKKNAQADATRVQGQTDAEHIRLVQKCQDPEVRRTLAPFLAVGLWQPGDRFHAPILRDRGPMSFSKLGTFGALKPNAAGLKALYNVGSGKTGDWPTQRNPDTDRPKWSYPDRWQALTQDQWQELRQTQALLNELGSTMVELKMLDP